jgi:hypothetical protein
MGSKFIVPADPQGPTDFDVTFEILLMGSEKAMELDADDYARDELRYAHQAPDWAQNWGGPFEVDVPEDEIAALFTIIR